MTRTNPHPTLSIEKGQAEDALDRHLANAITSTQDVRDTVISLACCYHRNTVAEI
jgi:hypothetical protein